MKVEPFWLSAILSTFPSCPSVLSVYLPLSLCCIPGWLSVSVCLVCLSMCLSDLCVCVSVCLFVSLYLPVGVQGSCWRSWVRSSTGSPSPWRRSTSSYCKRLSFRCTRRSVCLSITSCLAIASCNTWRRTSTRSCRFWGWEIAVFFVFRMYFLELCHQKNRNDGMTVMVIDSWWMLIMRMIMINDDHCHDQDYCHDKGSHYNDNHRSW